jgi:HEAT repeat protein
MDGGSGSARHIQAPEGLLRSALEKIVFFECRVSQLESELAAAQAAGDRARADGAQARRREVELEQALAAEKGMRGETDRRAAEAEERVRLLEAERERLLGGLVVRARIAGAPGSPDDAGEEGQADLAGFIAELRGEIEALRAFKASALAAGFGGDGKPVAPAPGPGRVRDAASLAELGGRFDAAGRVGLSAGEAARMKDLFATRADRALYERSMEDLDGADAGRRLRAVHALEALGSRAAAPLLAAALGRERGAEVKAALLAALARLKEPFALDLAERELSDPRPLVRVAALEALATGSDPRALDRLAGALGDGSAVVRRRAALLLGFATGERAEEALAIALADADRGVARAAAAALSGRPSATAQAALARGLEHGDASVRGAAAAALGRLSGEVVESEGTPSARRASGRRIAEKLSAMGAEELRTAVLRGAAPAGASAERVLAATGRASGPATATRSAIATPSATRTPTPTSPATANPTAPATATAAAARAARTAVAVLDAPLAPPAPAVRAGDHGLEGRILAELRAALRGCNEAQLSSVLATCPAEVEAALAALAARGAAERRGTRWFTS